MRLAIRASGCGGYAPSRDALRTPDLIGVPRFCGDAEARPAGQGASLATRRWELLFDSRAILDYLDGIATPDQRLVPPEEPHSRRVLRVEAVALGLTEKLYERVFELSRRDPVKREPAVLQRVEQQISSALAFDKTGQPVCNKRDVRSVNRSRRLRPAARERALAGTL
jgi:hypothetical protein